MNQDVYSRCKRALLASSPTTHHKPPTRQLYIARTAKANVPRPRSDCSVREAREDSLEIAAEASRAVVVRAIGMESRVRHWRLDIQRRIAQTSSLVFVAIERSWTMNDADIKCLGSPLIVQASVRVNEGREWDDGDWDNTLVHLSSQCCCENPCICSYICPVWYAVFACLYGKSAHPTD